MGLNKALMLMPEAKIAELLEHEKAHKARHRIMMRLYHRLSKLRGIREKMELAKHAKA